MGSEDNRDIKSKIVIKWNGFRTVVASFIATNEGVPAKVADEPADDVSEESVTELRSLSPVFNPDEHEGYVRVLTAEMAKSAPDAPLNVALTGHYGSGKSSVLMEATKRLVEDGHRVVNLSLPSLGVGNGRIPDDKVRQFDTTNLIQKEIVKQLLYRRSPAKTPASRYSRLDTFDSSQARKTSGAIALLAALVGALLTLPSKVESAVPADAWTWLNDHTFAHAAGSVQWLSLAVVFAAAFWAATALQRLLQQRLRVTELGAGAGPAKLKLSEPTSSYFDEYLDEIVYFFQTSKTNIVVFEDLDRFKDPHIFETLRELNLLLNNAEQTGSEPIRFVYAIRDSIFEQLDTEPEPAGEPSGPKDGIVPPTKSDALSEAEARRLITTNRTKFFDIVIPIVPFISHRTSRTLMTAELELIPDDQRPGRPVIDLVSAYLTDMRLIKNICNEYDLFRTRILKDDGLEGLTADKLFASVVYKNLYLRDYEHLRNGDSLIDKVYLAYREWVAQQTAAQRSKERQLRVNLRRLNSVSLRSNRLGKRLQDVILARAERKYSAEQVKVVTDSTTYEWADLLKADFWRAFIEDETTLTFQYSPGNYQPVVNEKFTFAKVETLLNEPLNIADWMSRDRRELLESISQAKADQLRFAHTPMKDAITSGESFDYDDTTQKLDEYAKSVFKDADIVLDLLQSGFIDENFTLYVTQFPGDSSASATNFILKAVQPDVMDIDYHFGTDETPNVEDIKAALDAEGRRILSGRSVYNKEIFDYLLATDADRLAEPVQRLALGGDDDVRFIDAYVESGAHAGTFMTMLSGHWSKVFEHLIGDDPESVDVPLLNAALMGVGSTVAYDLTDDQRSIVDSLFGQLDLAKRPLAGAKAASLAKAIAKMGVLVSNLSEVKPPLRTELVEQSAFRLNRLNLETIAGAGGSISMDALKALKPGSAYEKVLEDLQGYLDIVDSDPAVPTVTSSAQMVVVLTDVSQVDEDMVEPFAKRADKGCVVSDLDSLAESLWPAVVSADRMPLSATNVALYVASYDFDEALVKVLSSHDAIDPDGEESEHADLALKLLNTAELTVDVKLKLVESLDLDEHAIDPEALKTESRAIIPQLVERHLVEDDADAYTALVEDDYGSKHRLILASENFVNYWPQLQLATNDVRTISRDGTPAIVKASVVNNIAAVSGVIGSQGAAGLAGGIVRPSSDG
jgi:hypothetical protein